MICVSLAEPTLKATLKALKDVDFAEIRLDLMKLKTPEIQMLFSRLRKLIATCRRGPYDEETRLGMLREAIFSGASFVDIEVDSSDESKKAIVTWARRKKCKVIVSFHDFQKTPSRQELEEVARWCFESGGDIAKISCRCHSFQDAARLLGLLDSPKKIIAIGMGKDGRVTRVLGPLLGSPFTYACLAPGKEIAEGQIDHKSLKKCLGYLL